MEENSKKSRTALRLTPTSQQSLMFLVETLGVTPSTAMRRAIQYYAYIVASSIPEPLAKPVETNELAISNLP